MYEYLYKNLFLPAFETGIKRRKTLTYWAESEQSQWWSREQLEAHQLGALQNLLRHAYETCPFHRDRWRAAGLNPHDVQSLADFHKWPLLTRDTIRSHRDEICSVVPYERIRKATGGSTGEPLQFELDMGSYEHRNAMTNRGYRWAGGEPGTKQLFLWGDMVGEISPLQKLKHAAYARFHRQKKLSCFNMTPARMRQYFHTVNEYRPEVIVAYAHSLYEFAKFLGEQQLVPFSPKSLIVGAEKIHDFQRQTIESVFQAPVFETYGSREFMLMGAECEHHSGMHLSMENLLIEIVDDDGRPTPVGEEGNVVVTDLHNYAMPFVRYVNGDRAVAGFDMCACGRGLPLLKQVTGRQTETIETPSGRKVSGIFFPHVLKEFPSIKQFQVVQSAPERIRLKLVVTEDFSDSDRAMLLGEIYRFIGSDVEVNLEFVDDIPLTKAGKHRAMVREC